MTNPTLETTKPDQQSKVWFSLATKCQLLFGLSVTLIIVAALSLAWVRMKTLVIQGQRTVAEHEIAGVIDRIQAHIESRQASTSLSIDLATKLELRDRMIEMVREVVNRIEKRRGPGTKVAAADFERLVFISQSEFELQASQDPGFLEVVGELKADTLSSSRFRESRRDVSDEAGGKRVIRDFMLIRMLKLSDLIQLNEPAAAKKEKAIEDSEIQESSRESSQEAVTLESQAQPIADARDILGVLALSMPQDQARKQLTLNRIYLLAAGILAGLLAIASFWYVTMRLILSPVRVLERVADKVSEGDIQIRADINTGDEFERLSSAFNQMLENLREQQNQLRDANQTLDQKLGELAQTNVSLFEANKMKGDFLANVSHELRTPLHSIVGFAELLQEQLDTQINQWSQDVTIGANDIEDLSKQMKKQQRYADNIIQSGQLLLKLINELLDLARIEAGRMDLRLETVSVQDLVESLIQLIRPLTERKKQRLSLEVDSGLPRIETDPGKCQQILFNLLANAVKFSPVEGDITLKVSRYAGDKSEALDANGKNEDADYYNKVAITVADTGPGIPEDQREAVFDKFTRLERGDNQSHEGTGLGLAIATNLADLLQGEITLKNAPEPMSSEPSEGDSVYPVSTSEVSGHSGNSGVSGGGAVFTLILPVKMVKRKGLMAT